MKNLKLITMFATIYLFTPLAMANFHNFVGNGPAEYNDQSLYCNDEDIKIITEYSLEKVEKICAEAGLSHTIIEINTKTSMPGSFFLCEDNSFANNLKINIKYRCVEPPAEENIDK